MIDILTAIFLGAMLFFSTLLIIVLVLGFIAFIICLFKEIFDGLKGENNERKH